MADKRGIKLMRNGLTKTVFSEDDAEHHRTQLGFKDYDEDELIEKGFIRDPKGAGGKTAAAPKGAGGKTAAAPKGAGGKTAAAPAETPDDDDEPEIVEEVGTQKD